MQKPPLDQGTTLSFFDILKMVYLEEDILDPTSQIQHDLWTLYPVRGLHHNTNISSFTSPLNLRSQQTMNAARYFTSRRRIPFPANSSEDSTEGKALDTTSTLHTMVSLG